MNLPQHVAIIMDGNGRWAENCGRARTYGHIRGARVAKKIITQSVELGLKNLTLFAFSTENWSRPQSEVDFLMRLLGRQIAREQQTLMKNNVRFRAIGDLSRLPSAVRAIVYETVEMTSQNTGLNLVFALSYGGRQEILEACKKIALQAINKKIDLANINEEIFAETLESSFLPDPDLIIRTSGEQRLSNFFLWQAAYSEIYIAEKLWPDFSEKDFVVALNDYAKRTRRFGGITTVNTPMVEKPELKLI